MSSMGESAQATLLQMLHGYRISQMIHVAAKLGLADLVAEGPQSAAELAALSGAHAPSLYRLLRALSSLGVFAEDDHGRFGLTPLGRPLQTGVPDSVYAMAIFACHAHEWGAWAELGYSVATGEPAFPRVFGMGSWEYRAQNPEADAIFNDAMTAGSRRDIPAIIAAYDFSHFGTVVDVGGGHGALIAAVLQAHPALRGILFDQPHVVAGAGPLLEAASLADRCAIVAGSFFETVPPGGDAYLLRRIIHDWDDEESVAILRQCHAAMPAHGRLLLFEGVVQPANRPDPTKLTDIMMLVMLGGRERTEAEYQALLARGGFALSKVYPTAGQSSIVEGVRA